MHVREKLIPGGWGHVCLGVYFCVTIAVSCTRPFFFPSFFMYDKFYPSLILHFLQPESRPTLAVELLECTVTLCHRSKALQIPSDDPSLLPLVLDEDTRVQEYHGGHHSVAQSQQRQEVPSASLASQ